MFFGLYGSGAIGLFACCVADLITLNTTAQNHNTTTHGNFTKEQYERTCGKSIGSSKSYPVNQEERNEKGKNLEEGSHCYANIVTQYYSTQPNNKSE